MSFLFLNWQKLTLAVTLFPFILAFTFTNTNPSECDNLTVSWTGGQPPFRLLVISPGQPIRNLSIPATAFENDAGSFTTRLTIAKSQRVMLALSDALGVASGGISALLTVGDSISGNSCNTRSPAVDFYFSLDTDLEECKPYPFSQYPNAVQPITIYGFVPLGQSFTLYPPRGDTFEWKNNLTAGTSVAFSMMDSQGRNGGTSPIGIVKLSDNKSCISSSGLISSSSTTVPLPSSSSDMAQPNPSKSNKGAIAGAVIGGVGVIAIIAWFILFLKRRQRTRISISNKTDLLSDAPHSPPADTGPFLSGEYAVTPFEAVAPSLSSLSRKGQTLQSMGTEGRSTSSSPLMSDFRTGPSSGHAPLLQHDLRPSSAHSLSGAGTSPNGGGMLMYASLQSQEMPLSRDAPLLPLDRASTRPLHRVIVHTDIAESDEPLELPPSYSEGRVPIPGLLSSNIPAPGSSSVPSQGKIRL